jgi:hypothetical protein
MGRKGSRGHFREGRQGWCLEDLSHELRIAEAGGFPDGALIRETLPTRPIDQIAGAMRDRLPEDIEAEDLAGFVGRNRERLEGMLGPLDLADGPPRVLITEALAEAALGWLKKSGLSVQLLRLVQADARCDYRIVRVS